MVVGVAVQWSGGSGSSSGRGTLLVEQTSYFPAMFRRISLSTLKHSEPCNYKQLSINIWLTCKNERINE